MGVTVTTVYKCDICGKTWETTKESNSANMNTQVRANMLSPKPDDLWNQRLDEANQPSRYVDGCRDCYQTITEHERAARMIAIQLRRPLAQGG